MLEYISKPLVEDASDNKKRETIEFKSFPLSLREKISEQ